jgi:hypothetical protein
MHAASGRRRLAFVALLVFVLAAAALWASIALAGSGSSAKTPVSKPAAGQVAHPSRTAKPAAKSRAHECPFQQQANADTSSV